MRERKDLCLKKTQIQTTILFLQNLLNFLFLLLDRTFTLERRKKRLFVCVFRNDGEERYLQRSWDLLEESGNSCDCSYLNHCNCCLNRYTGFTPTQQTQTQARTPASGRDARVAAGPCVWAWFPPKRENSKYPKDIPFVPIFLYLNTSSFHSIFNVGLNVLATFSPFQLLNQANF